MKDTTGKSLENDFAVWMEKRLGYSKTYKRELVKGKIADRPYEVDIHGVHTDHQMEIIRKVSIGAFILGVLSMAAPKDFEWFHQIAVQLVGSVAPGYVGSAMIIVSIGSFIIAKTAGDRKITHAWVECKDMKTTVKRKDVQKLAASVEDVKRVEAGKWHPQKVLMVSGSGFDQDALAIAKDKSIICYEKVQNGFKKICN